MRTKVGTIVLRKVPTKTLDLRVRQRGQLGQGDFSVCRYPVATETDLRYCLRNSGVRSRYEAAKLTRDAYESRVARARWKMLKVSELQGPLRSLGPAKTAAHHA